MNQGKFTLEKSGEVNTFSFKILAKIIIVPLMVTFSYK